VKHLQDVDALVLRCMRGEASFDEALNAVVAYQLQWNTPLARWWAQRGYSGDCSDADRIPAVPTDVFRFVPLQTSECAPERVFRTSGTTSGARGEHSVASTKAYESGAALQWERWVQPGGAPMTWHALTFDPAEVPDSSLAFMVGRLAQLFSHGAPRFYVRPDGVDALGARDALRAEVDPVVVVGTAFALVELLDVIDPAVPLALPVGSRVVETGGFKGRTRTIEREEFYGLLADRLGVPQGSIVSEYSMTELSSQLYTDSIGLGGAASGLLQAPPWVKVSAVDPLTLAPLPKGSAGLLRFVDLANTSTVVAVQTADVGVVHAAGVELRGRVAGAVPRGCGLAIEEIVGLAGTRGAK
jgi:hypothetical protein